MLLGARLFKQRRERLQEIEHDSGGGPSGSEKERFAKRSIWQDGAGVPLIMAGPGIAKDKICDKPMQLPDIYPTLLDLTGLKADQKHEGHSLKSLPENPDEEEAHAARSSFGPGSVAIVSERYRYIHYNDGSAELYDRLDDLNEWHNLAGNPEKKNALDNTVPSVY